MQDGLTEVLIHTYVCLYDVNLAKVQAAPGCDYSASQAANDPES